VDLHEYAQLDATALAAAIRAGETTAEEVEDVARRAIAAVDGDLHAVVETIMPALPGGGPDAPFAGVPFAIKDLVIAAEGVPSRGGSRFVPPIPAPADSDLMARFRAAGLRTLAVTASPEFGFNATTEPKLHGPTRNPWRTDHSPGGSSGGSGALVAARAVPVAHANDGGGSIRIPAAVNGLVGLKPTRGRTPLGPAYAEALAGMAIEFAVTRTVRDAAGLLDAVHGPGIGEKYHPPRYDGRYADEVGADPGRLRIAFTTEPWSGVPVDPECVEAVEGLAGALEELGHEVSRGMPQFDVGAFDLANQRLWCAFLAANVAMLQGLTGVAPSSENLEACTMACAEFGASLTAVDLMAAEQIQNSVARSVGAWFETVDVLVTPTLAHATFPLGLLDQDDASLDAAGWCRKVFTHVPFTPLFNMTGQPAINVPVMWTADGRPSGTQLVARFGREDVLLRLAAQLEEARPWSGRVPPVSAASGAGAPVA
jgi:amidase